MNPSQREIDELRACYEAGNQAQAVALARALTEKYPQHPVGWRALGVILYLAGRHGEALAPMQQLVRMFPQEAGDFNNLGVTLRDLGRPAEGEPYLRQALVLEPGFHEAHYNLGNALKDQGRLAEAEPCYREAARLKPDYAEAHLNLGALYMSARQYEQALASLEAAYAINPRLDYLPGQKLHFQMMLCRWDRFDEQLRLLEQELAQGKRAATPFPVLCLTDDEAVHLQAAKTYVAAHFPPRDLGIERRLETAAGKIRIGYYSADFHNHATAYLMAELIEEHDSSRFEFHGFSFGPAKGDEMRARVAGAFDAFHDVSGMSDAEIAQMSRALGIDVAVDLKGFTEGSRTGIFAARAAPVQVNYLGYPGTMGASYIDYIIADETVIPAAQWPFYKEKVVHLPHSYQVNDSKRRISDKPFTRRGEGLPDEAFVFCCFNNTHKILPASFDGWMRILAAVDASVLWLFTANPAAVANLRAHAAARGIDPQRLVFAERLPLDEHLARHRLADLFLDTLPYNAHTTASDALWAGLPVITCMGKSFASRVAASLLRAVNMPELVTESQATFEAEAIRLARSPAALAELRAKLERNRQTAPLFDGRLFARYIEAAYGEMVRRARAGLPPAPMKIQAA